MSTKAKMQQAKELIQAKRYDAARQILKTVEHPTAKVWLERLDSMSPPPRRNRRMLVFVVLVLIVAAVVVLLVANQMMGDAARQALNLTAP